MKNSTYWFKSIVFAISLFYSFNSYTQTAVNVVNSFSGSAGVTASSIFTLSSVEVLSGTNRLMLVGVSTKDGKVTSIKYNNVPLNLVGYLDGTIMSTQAPIENGSNGAEVYIYSYLNPPVGTADVVVTLDSDYKKGIVVGATNFSGVDQSNPLGTFTSAVYHDGSESPFVLNVPSSIGSLIFDVSSVRNGTQTMDAGQTQLYNINSGTETHGGSSTKLATTTTTSMSWSSTSCQEVGRAAIAINPLLPTVSNSSVSVTCDLIATQDTYIKKKNDTENFGSCTDLLIDREGGDLHRALFQFDLSSIPPNSTILSAELRLNCTVEKNMNVSVFQIGASDVWDEGSSCASDGISNWTGRQGASIWSALGVVGDNSSDGTPLGTISGNTLGIQSWPLTSLVQDWFDGTATNNGVMVGSQDGGGDRMITYDSRETTTGIPPALRVTYTIDLDSDFDGVFDHVDIDDDNDGILDTDECATIVNPPLLNPDFEALDILTLDGGPTDVVTTSGIWKGDASNIPNWLSSDATNNYLEIWHNTQGAGNDAGGVAYSGTHWAEVNATTNDGLYQDVVSTPGDVLQWTFAHRKRTGYAGSSNEDIVRLIIGDPGGTMSSQGNFFSANDASWTLHSGTYVVPAGQTTTRLSFTVLATASGSTSSGNFIDNVQLFVIPTDCADTDADSIPDYLDLDSDNDGIPDMVEAGFGSLSAGTATIPLNVLIDVNNNGMHDAFENTSPLDSDGDGVPNYKDLDSDNDSVFDVDEASTKRYVYNALTFDNGDGDINGDGIGDGTESEAFRVRTIPGACTELFGDGILDIYDYGTGANEYGNLSQGTGPLFVNDTDGDGIPDYLELDSNNDGVFDIAETYYANLDANNDGVIDDTLDSDGDGLMDAFDTNDTAFGSPRDLQDKLDLFFDGRNDYVEDTNVMNGWNEATLMAWIKLDPSASGNQVIMGQDAFYLQINSNLEIEAKANGKTVNSAVINTNQWTHVTATYSNTNSKIKLYINGEEVGALDVSGALPSDTSSLTLGRQPDTDSNYFHGYIDEARVFFKALTDNELQKMVYQEIEDNNGVIKGAIIPTDITNFVDASTNIPLTWSNLKRYYRMDAYKDDVLDDLTTPEIDEGSGARIYNVKIIVEQSAPLPLVTQQSGRLEEAINNTEKGINGDDALNASAIVKIKHNDVYIDSNLQQVGLIIDQQDASSTPIEFNVLNDSELNVSWYLKLDGKIDLEGESQLVQGAESYLDPTSSGSLEKDQQGTADTYTYNYWAMPVGVTNNTTNNNNYSLPDVFDVNFLTSGYNGSASPVGIADHWIWKFANQPDDDYASWQHVRSTGSINPGEGFTMKGPGTGSITSEQNYVLNGKPNNGDINLTINAGNDYLIGNPYASALDASKFISDNSSSITGTLYFWEHWGGGSHYLADYQGGYHLLNLSGATTAATLGSNDPDVGTGGTPTKLPGNFIPVSQGFFVVADSDGGTINFNNGQRIFHKESSGNSTFVGMNNETGKTASNTDNESNGVVKDTRLKLRIGFNSVNTIRRQLLTTVDTNASASIDFGYDGKHNEAQMDDMFWLIEDERFVIQGINAIDEQTILPIGLYTKNQGINSIVLDKLEFAPEGLNVYVHDKVLDIYHDLKESSYDIFLPAGEYLDRFEITFSNSTVQYSLDIEDHNKLTTLNVYYTNAKKSLILINPSYYDIKSIEVLNILGQSIHILKNVSNLNHAEIKLDNLSSGTYIIKLNSIIGTVSKKILVE